MSFLVYLKLVMFFLLALIVFIGIPAGIFALILYTYKKYESRKFLRFIFLIPTVIFSLTLFEYYITFYPLDSFYKKDFKKVTGLTLSNSAVIIRKDASYPDLQGDYCSAAEIRLNKEDYQKLLYRIKNDKSFKDAVLVNSSNQYDYVTQKQNLNYAYKFSKMDYVQKYKFIGFLNDGQTVVYHFCG